MNNLNSLIVLSILTASLCAEKNDTYLLSSSSISEWEPPTKKVKELPDARIKKVHLIEKDGRHICIEECEPPVAEQKAVNSPKLIAVDSVSIEERSLHENQDGTRLIHVSSTVYYENGKPFSRIRVQSKGERIDVWSSMNAIHLGGIASYVAEGVEYYPITSQGEVLDISASEAGCPVNRERLNQEKARFLVVGQKLQDSYALEAMKGLHVIYNKELENLKAANIVRKENARKAREWEEANPKQPEDVTIRIWKRDPNSPSN